MRCGVTSVTLDVHMDSRVRVPTWQGPAGLKPSKRSRKNGYIWKSPTSPWAAEAWRVGEAGLEGPHGRMRLC